MARRFNIITRNGLEGLESSFPFEWEAENTLLFGNDLPSMIADSTKRHCPNQETCAAGGYVEHVDGRLILAAATCQIEMCPIGQ